MRILVTNDDGIESEGIHALARSLAETPHEVMVVAPNRNYSGAGASIGDLDPGKPLDVEKVEIPGAEGVEAWSLDGPPALTVIAANLGAFGDPPDLVVSGINAGLNTGRAILHSGTVGAVLAGQNFGISGLAVSIDWAEPWHWETAASLAVEVLDLVIAAPSSSAINLNVPSAPREDIKGIQWARIAPYGSVRARVRNGSGRQLEFEFEQTGFTADPDTDQGAVEQGYAALTTLVGVVEAWPPEAERSDPQVFETHLRPGAPLDPVHVVPDATDHRLLRRPEVGL